MFIPFGFWKNNAVSVCDRFIAAHEAATGHPMAAHQRSVVCTFVQMLYGVGTNNGTDLMTRMIEYGSLLFPLCPTNDNDAYMAGFEIDLVSGTKMGDYINMDDSHMTVQGALPNANGQRFQTYKTPSDYPIQNNYCFAYHQNNVPRVNNYIFGAGTTQDNSLNMIVNSPGGNGWAYCRYNGDYGIVIQRYGYKGQVGLWHRINNNKFLYKTYNDGSMVKSYGSYESIPDRTNSTPFSFHTATGVSSRYSERLSMYGFGINFDSNDTAAFNDLSQAIRYFQENILSNDTRRWI